MKFLFRIRDLSLRKNVHILLHIVWIAILGFNIGFCDFF